MNPNNCDSCGHDRNMCICPKPGTVVVTANEMQVGGNHYRNKGYQHWDWIVDNKIGYLAGCATKYIARHKKKNGRQDLDKAHHFLSKLIEVNDRGFVNQSMFKSLDIMEHRHSKILTDNFIMASNLDHEQAVMVRLLAQYEDRGDLVVALNILHQYREAQYPSGPFCVICGTKLVGDVCPRVGCYTLVPGATPQRLAETTAAASVARRGAKPDSRGITGMEDPRGYEGDD